MDSELALIKRLSAVGLSSFPIYQSPEDVAADLGVMVGMRNALWWAVGDLLNLGDEPSDEFILSTMTAIVPQPQSPDWMDRARDVWQSLWQDMQGYIGGDGEKRLAAKWVQCKSIAGIIPINHRLAVIPPSYYRKLAYVYRNHNDQYEGWLNHCAHKVNGRSEAPYSVAMFNKEVEEALGKEPKRNNPELNYMEPTEEVLNREAEEEPVMMVVKLPMKHRNGIQEAAEKDGISADDWLQRVVEERLEAYGIFD